MIYVIINSMILGFINLIFGIDNQDKTQVGVGGFFVIVSLLLNTLCATGIIQ